MNSHLLIKVRSGLLISDMGLFKKGSIPADTKLPVYTDWDEFEPDAIDASLDADDAAAHHDLMKHLVTQDQIDKH